MGDALIDTLTHLLILSLPSFISSSYLLPSYLLLSHFIPFHPIPSHPVGHEVLSCPSHRTSTRPLACFLVPSIPLHSMFLLLPQSGMRYADCSCTSVIFQSTEYTRYISHLVFVSVSQSVSQCISQSLT